MLINAGRGFSQDVDVVTGLLHVEQEEDWDNSEGKHHQPDEGQDVCHYNKLIKRRVVRNWSSSHGDMIKNYESQSVTQIKIELKRQTKYRVALKASLVAVADCYSFCFVSVIILCASEHAYHQPLTHSQLHPLDPPCPHREAKAAATLGAPEFTKCLLDCTGAVETLGQKQDAVEEEK